MEKKYYKNIIAKIKDKETILSIASIMTFLEDKSAFKIVFRLYRIKSFTNNIFLEDIYKILSNKFTSDLVYKIIELYLKNDVSFDSIKNCKGDNNTIKIITNIKYSKKLKNYQTFIEYPPLLHIKDSVIIRILISNISKNLDSLLNSNKFVNINDIFAIKNNQIEFYVVHKIYNSYNGWGISW